MPHLVLITSLSPATNPRFAKEVELALAAGYKVTIVCFQFSHWSRQQDKVILDQWRKKGTDVQEIAAGRMPFFSWVASTVVMILARYVWRLFPSSPRLIAYGLDKRTCLLERRLQVIRENPDWIIAHNPGSFYPACRFALHKKAQLGIDMEDYHPGEGRDASKKKRLEQLLHCTLPGAAYISYASPLIQEYTEKLLSPVIVSGFTIPNVFPKDDFMLPEEKAEGPLKMIWFSQYIDLERGLEALLPVYDQYKDSIALTLIGNRRAPFYEQYLKERPGIKVLNPLPQKELHQLLCQFDVGLALEPGKDLNNTLALSNKLFAYFQAGLFILVSDTRAQKHFIADLPEHGICTALEIDTLTATVEQLLKNKEQLRMQQQERFERAARYNWENAAVSLLGQWSSIHTKDKSVSV